MDANEKLAAGQSELAIDVEKVEQVCEPSNTQLPPIPTTRHLSCVAAANYVNKVRKTRNDYCFILALVPLGGLALFALINEMGWARISTYPAYWAFCVGLFALTWWLFGRWINQIDSWSAAELDFSEDSLRVSYRLLKSNPELIIPWSAIDNVGYASNDTVGNVFVIFIRDGNIASQLRTNIKKHFGSSFWIGTPWTGSISDAWWVRIFDKEPHSIRILINSTAAAEDLQSVVIAWRGTVALRENTHLP